MTVVRCPHCNGPLTYVAARPEGRLYLCPQCGEKILVGATRQEVTGVRAATAPSDTTPAPALAYETDTKARVQNDFIGPPLPPSLSTHSALEGAPAAYPLVHKKKGIAAKVLVACCAVFAAMAVSCWLLVPASPVAAILFSLGSVLSGAAALACPGEGRARKTVLIAGTAISLAVALACSLSYIAPASDAAKLTNGHSVLDMVTSALTKTGKKATWDDMTFSLGESQFVLGKATLSDLAEAGWQLDLKANGYDDGYMVEPNQLVSLAELSFDGADDDSEAESKLYVNVLNPSPVAIPIQDCELVKVSFIGKEQDGAMSVMGVRPGDDIDRAVGMFGVPGAKYGEDGEMTTFSYYTDGYEKMMTVSASKDGAISELTLSFSVD